MVHKANAVAAQSGVGIAEVLVYPLEKAYRPEKFPAVVRELDARAAQLAGQQRGGRLVSRATMNVGGRKVRYYRIDFDPGRTEEIAFFLRGKTEFFLLCRRQSSGSNSACTRLFASFSPV